MDYRTLKVVEQSSFKLDHDCCNFKVEIVLCTFLHTLQDTSSGNLKVPDN